MKLARLLCAAAIFAAGCGPSSYVVLLPDEDGNVGEVEVSNAAGEQTLNAAGTATAIDSADRAPSSPWELAGEKLQEVFGAVFSARPPEQEQYTLYFELGTTELTDDSEPDLAALLDSVRERDGVDADVVGHADRYGSARRSDWVAMLRAYHVQDLLAEAGVDPARVDVTSFGETRPAVETRDGVAEPKNRRVEVTIR